ADDSSASNKELDNKVIVTANRVSQNLIDVMADVEVIERADIERMQPQSFVDLLQSVAGVDVIKRGGHGQNSSLFTRGTNSNQTLILIDGVRVGSATLGEKSISSISVTQIERIEIVKGPRAAIWGSDAISGVIQIFTRRYDVGEYQARVSAGDNGSHSTELSVGFGTESFTNTFTYGLKEFDGIDARLSYDDDEDGSDIESLALRGDYQLSESSTIDWVVQKDQSVVEFDTGFGGDITRTENDILNLRYLFETDDWHLSASYKESSDSAVTFGNGIARADGGIFETEREQVNLMVRNQLSDNWGLAFGVDWYEDNIEGTTTVYAKEQRDTSSYYLAADYNSDSYLFDIAVRRDDVEEVTEETTFNLAAGYRLTEDQVISLNLGEGFKAPSFNDLYFPWGGNPDLQFETSENVELIYKASLGSLFYTVSLFDSTIENLIQWTPDSNGIWSPGNVGKAEISGLNFSATIRDDELTHKFTASFVDAKDAATDEQLIRRAKKKMTYDLIASHGAFETFVQAQYVGDRPDSDYQTFEATQLDNYFQINVGVGYEFNSNWKVNLKVNDLTREEPVQVSGYRPLEEEVYLSVTYQNLN
ncbi:MAG: TonB-dependent receptor, partial [Kangiellaceae bacterium]|nr:TonB-dependent receptor [Kangiellaceae bacterium]